MQNKLFLKAADICELLEVKQTSAYEIILCMFESCDTEEFTEIFGTLLPYAVEKNNDLFIVKDYLLYIRHDFGHVKSRRQKRPSHHAYRFCYSGSRPSYIMLSSP